MPHDVAQGGVAPPEGRRRDLAAPGKRRPFRLRRRADEGAAADITAQQPARLELPVRADDGGTADAEALGERTFGWNARPRWQITLRNRRFEQRDEMSV